METASAKRESHTDRPLTSPKNQSKSSPPSAEKTRTKSSSDSPASGNCEHRIGSGERKPVLTINLFL